MNINERKLNIKDMIYYIISRWLLIIISGIIGGAVLTGGKYLLDKMEEEKKSATASLEEVQEKLDEEQLKDVKHASELYIMVDDWDEYLQNSPLLKLDPYDVKRDITNYHIDLVVDIPIAEKENKVTSIVSAFVNYIESGACAKDVVDKNKIEIDVRYVDELISVSCNSSNDHNASFVVKVIDVPEIDDLESLVNLAVDEYANVLIGNFGEYTISIVDEYETVGYDSNIESRRNGVINNLSSNDNKLTIMLDGFNDDQMKYYRYITGYQEESEEVEISILIVIVGICFGIGAACVCIVFLMFASKYIITENDYKAVLEMNLLGTVFDKQDSNSKKSFYVRKIYKNAISKTYEECLENIIINIKALCKKDGYRKFIIMSTKQDIVEDYLIGDIINKLNDENIEFYVVSGENVKKTYLEKDIDACIDVEVFKKSKIVEINELRKSTFEIGIPIVGVVNYVV